MKNDWMMIRVPAELHAQLAEFCRKITRRTDHPIRTRVVRKAGELLAKMVWVAPLHVGLKELLRRDAEHAKRGKRKKNQ